MTTPITFEGGCLCRAVRYRASGQPLERSLCHCSTCRRASGAPAVAWVVWPSNNFSWIAGSPTTYASSPGVERTFCNRCGTPLTYQKTGERSTIDVTTASLDTPEALPPTVEIWTDHRLRWQCVNTSLPQYPRGSKDEDEP